MLYELTENFEEELPSWIDANAVLRPDDEVTLRLTITGLYPAIREHYGLVNEFLSTDQQCADLNQESYENGEVSLIDLIEWLDDTSDIRVKMR